MIQHYNFGFRILIQSGRDNQIKTIKMKKFIPIFSIVIASVCMQNCANRDEEIVIDYNQFDQIEKTSMMRGDSTKTSGDTVDTDPPVRDGDNWRLVPNN